jgi:hypothetical protein
VPGHWLEECALFVEPKKSKSSFAKVNAPKSFSTKDLASSRAASDPDDSQSNSMAAESEESSAQSAATNPSIAAAIVIPEQDPAKVEARRQRFGQVEDAAQAAADIQSGELFNGLVMTSNNQNNQRRNFYHRHQHNNNRHKNFHRLNSNQQ